MKKIFIKFVVFPVITVITIFAILFIEYLINPNSDDTLINILLGIPIIAIFLLIPVNIYFIIKRKEYIWLLLVVFAPLLGSLIYYFLKYKKYEDI